MNDEDVMDALQELENGIVRPNSLTPSDKYYTCSICRAQADARSMMKHQADCAIHRVRRAIMAAQLVVREEAEDYRESSKAASDPLAERMYADAMGSPHAAGQVKLSGLTSDEWIARTARNAIRMARIFREAENETR